MQQFQKNTRTAHASRDARSASVLSTAVSASALAPSCGWCHASPSGVTSSAAFRRPHHRATCPGGGGSGRISGG
jgi:hypothetical protein